MRHGCCGSARLPTFLRWVGVFMDAEWIEAEKSSALFVSTARHGTERVTQTRQCRDSRAVKSKKSNLGMILKDRYGSAARVDRGPWLRVPDPKGLLWRCHFHCSLLRRGDLAGFPPGFEADRSRSKWPDAIATTGRQGAVRAPFNGPVFRILG